MPLNSLVRNVYNTPDSYTGNDRVGIELEYEGFHGWTYAGDCHHWRTEADGSLRNGGIEFISNPLMYEVIEPAIAQAELAVAAMNLQATKRCGIHVHLNMQPYTMGQMYSMICLYALLEPTIYNTYALDREGSMFAVPLAVNSDQLGAMQMDLRQVNRRRVPRADRLTSTSKYSALNFHSLRSFGTIEMRQPYCSTDFAAIRSWVQFCTRLTQVGTSYEDPLQVIEDYERDNLRTLQERMFNMSVPIEEAIQELAEDAAYMCVATREPTWQEINWENIICAA